MIEWANIWRFLVLYVLANIFSRCVFVEAYLEHKWIEGTVYLVVAFVVWNLALFFVHWIRKDAVRKYRKGEFDIEPEE